MTNVQHQVILRSLGDIGLHAPPDPLARIFSNVSQAVRRAIRMAFEGRSSTVGSDPSWLRAVADIRCVGMTGESDTVLLFEAPRLGDAAPKLYDQLEFWPTKPPRDQTGFDLLSEVVSDVTRRNEDSPRFDTPLLRQLINFRSALTGPYREIGLTDRESRENAVLNPVILGYASELLTETPRPARVRLVGKLDMIRDSTHAFAIKLEDGGEVPGVLVDGEMSSLTDLFKQRVLVVGTAVYRPSGKLLRVDAEAVTHGANELARWSKMPVARPPLTLRSVRVLQGPKTGAAAIKGKWPGDETDEEIIEALRALG